MKTWANRLGARRIAGLRLLASLGLATLFAPWLVLATALCSRVLVSHGPGVPWASQALLLLSWGLAALYGRGILQLDRSDAWFKSIYRLSGHDLQALPLECTLGLLTPPAAGGVVLQHWRAVRRWAWASEVVLMALAWLLARLPAGTALPWLLGASLGLTT